MRGSPKVSLQHHYGATDAPVSTPKWVIAHTIRHGPYGAMLQKDVASNITRLRKARGWSRPVLAKQIEPKTTYQQIERLEKAQRKLTIEWIEKIAKALEVSPYELVRPEGAMESVKFSLGQPVADEVARTLARVATGGRDPEDAVVSNLATMLQEFVETFAAHPATRDDPQRVKPVIDVLERRLSLR